MTYRTEMKKKLAADYAGKPVEAPYSTYWLIERICELEERVKELENGSIDNLPVQYSGGADRTTTTNGSQEDLFGSK